MNKVYLWVIVLISIIAIACSGGNDNQPKPPTNNNVSPTISNTAPKTKPGITISDGIYLVPSDVKPGTYTTTVPKDSINCYWARLRGTSGELNDIIANDNAEPGTRIIVTIKKTDKAFSTNGCGTWKLK